MATQEPVTLASRYLEGAIATALADKRLRQALEQEERQRQADELAARQDNEARTRAVDKLGQTLAGHLAIRRMPYGAAGFAFQYGEYVYMCRPHSTETYSIDVFKTWEPGEHDERQTRHMDSIPNDNLADELLALMGELQELSR